MAKKTTRDEEVTRDRMKRVYNDQKNLESGWNDWGMYTAHVVHGLIAEIAELREKLRTSGQDPGEERDPFVS